MQSLKLVDGDIVFENDELSMIEDEQELTQCCEITVQTKLTEWFLDPTIGLEYTKLRGKGVTDESVSHEIRRALRQEPRIKTVDAINIVRDMKARTMMVTFVATGQLGEQVRGGAALNA